MIESGIALHEPGSFTDVAGAVVGVGLAVEAVVDAGVLVVVPAEPAGAEVLVDDADLPDELHAANNTMHAIGNATNARRRGNCERSDMDGLPCTCDIR
jgi:hypothetical protein